jgi:hypothetical protein
MGLKTLVNSTRAVETQPRPRKYRAGCLDIKIKREASHALHAQRACVRACSEPRDAHSVPHLVHDDGSVVRAHEDLVDNLSPVRRLCGHRCLPLISEQVGTLLQKMRVQWLVRLRRAERASERVVVCTVSAQLERQSAGRQHVAQLKLLVGRSRHGSENGQRKSKIQHKAIHHFKQAD